MTVSEMAVYSGFSASHFRLLFKKETGQTPKTLSLTSKFKKHVTCLSFLIRK